MAGKYYKASLSPNTTNLNGHYQLVVIELRSIGIVASVGLTDLTTALDVIINTNDTLLPIPVVNAAAASGHRRLQQSLSTAPPPYTYRPVGLGSSPYTASMVGAATLRAVTYAPNASVW